MLHHGLLVEVVACLLADVAFVDAVELMLLQVKKASGCDNNPQTKACDFVRHRNQMCCESLNTHYGRQEPGDWGYKGSRSESLDRVSHYGTEF